MREYLSDTLKYARENAEFNAEHGANWNGWFEEKNWIGWQEHMENLVNRLDTLLACPKERLELVSLQKQEQGLQKMRNQIEKSLRGLECDGTETQAQNIKMKF